MRARPFLGLALGLVALGACSQDPYTADDGRADLIEAGYSEAEADCVVAGLDAYFREEFLAIQESEGIEPGVVPQRQAEIYVKNRFAGNLDVPPDLADEADRLVAECRA